MPQATASAVMFFFQTDLKSLLHCTEQQICLLGEGSYSHTGAAKGWTVKNPVLLPRGWEEMDLILRKIYISPFFLGTQVLYTVPRWAPLQALTRPNFQPAHCITCLQTRPQDASLPAPLSPAHTVPQAASASSTIPAWLGPPTSSCFVSCTERKKCSLDGYI